VLPRGWIARVRPQRRRVLRHRRRHQPVRSDGYSPIDERPRRREAFDAQRSTANTNDLRGKILRSHPQPDATDTIPDGNLFEPGTP
jgi:cytochrome c